MIAGGRVAKGWVWLIQILLIAYGMLRLVVMMNDGIVVDLGCWNPSPLLLIDIVTM